ncbi:MAG: hypothetical protein AAGI08_03480 [Bacteroidota bacterium]
MIRKDFLLRQLAEFVQVLARVMLNRTERRYDEAIEAAHVALRSLPDYDIESRHAATREDVIATCTAEAGTFSAELAVGVADVLYEEARSLEALGRDEEAELSDRHAAWLYAEAASVPGAALPLHVWQRGLENSTPNSGES